MWHPRHPTTFEHVFNIKSTCMCVCLDAQMHILCIQYHQLNTDPSKIHTRHLGIRHIQVLISLHSHLHKFLFWNKWNYSLFITKLKINWSYCIKPLTPLLANRCYIPVASSSHRNWINLWSLTHRVGKWYHRLCIGNRTCSTAMKEQHHSSTTYLTHWGWVTHITYASVN